MTTNGPMFYPPMPRYPAPRRRASGITHLGVCFAYIGVVAVSSGAAGVVLWAFFGDFDGNNPGSKANEGLAAVIPNIAIAVLLAEGGSRLDTGRASGRWLLNAAAVLNLALAATWGVYLARHHDLVAYGRFAWVMTLPPVLAAVLAWTPSARRWTSGPMPR